MCEAGGAALRGLLPGLSPALALWGYSSQTVGSTLFHPAAARRPAGPAAGPVRLRATSKVLGSPESLGLASSSSDPGGRRRRSLAGGAPSQPRQTRPGASGAPPCATGRGGGLGGSRLPRFVSIAHLRLYTEPVPPSDLGRLGLAYFFPSLPRANGSGPDRPEQGGALHLPPPGPWDHRSPSPMWPRYRR